MSDPSPFLDRAPIPTARALELLRHGGIEVRGRMPYSSNATFLVDIVHEGLAAQGIYKPARGERPLWDFPEGLYRREVAAFCVSEDLGWGLVPPTIVRHDGPLDIGSLQLFVPAVFEEHYFTLHETDDTHDDTFRRVCAFDIVINNTDRKSGHCLLGTDGRVWCIDHGVALHHEDKLRTVIWDFAGEPLPGEVRSALAGLLDRGVSETTRALLNPFEHDALLARSRALLDAGVFPSDDTGGHRWPWPLV